MMEEMFCLDSFIESGASDCIGKWYFGWPIFEEGRARTQSPTNTNYAPEFPSLGGIAGVNPFQVQ